MKNNNSKKKDLVKNSIILFLGKFSTQFISFLLLPLYTSHFSSDAYGTIDLITTYIVLLVPVITIQTEMYLFRYLIDCRSDDNEKASIISNSFFVVVLLSLLTCIIFGIVCVFVDIKYSVYLVLMVLSTIFSNILLQLVRGFGKNGDYSLACILMSGMNICFNFLFISFFKLGIESVFISTIISNFLGAFFLFIKNKVYFYLSLKLIHKEKIKEVVSYSLPLVPNGIVWWVIDTSDRTIITLILGLSANGIYSISNKFSHIINSFYSIFNMSWTESLSLYLYDNDDFLKSTFNSIVKLLCSLCLLLLSGMFLLFQIFIKGDYGDAYNYAFILVIASIFSMLSSNLSAIYIAAKQTQKIAITTIIAAIINLIIHLILIRLLGLYAAAISTLISFMLLFIIRLIDIQKIVKLGIDFKLLVLFFFLFIVSYYPYIYGNLIIKLFWLIITLFIVFIINFDMIKNIFGSLKRKRF